MKSWYDIQWNMYDWSTEKCTYYTLIRKKNGVQKKKLWNVKTVNKMFIRFLRESYSSSPIECDISFCEYLRGTLNEWNFEWAIEISEVKDKVG